MKAIKSKNMVKRTLSFILFSTFFAVNFTSCSLLGELDPTKQYETKPINIDIGEGSQESFYRADPVPNFSKESEAFADEYLNDAVNYFYATIKDSPNNERLVENTNYVFTTFNDSNNHIDGYFRDNTNTIAITENKIGNSFDSLVFTIGHELIHKYIYVNNMKEECKTIATTINNKIKSKGFPDTNILNNKDSIDYSKIFTYPYEGYTENTYLNDNEAFTHAFQELLKGENIPEEFMTYFDELLNKNNSGNYVIEKNTNDSEIIYEFNTTGKLVKNSDYIYNGSQEIISEYEYEDDWNAKLNYCNNKFYSGNITKFKDEYFKEYNIYFTDKYLCDEKIDHLIIGESTENYSNYISTTYDNIPTIKYSEIEEDMINFSLIIMMI